MPLSCELQPSVFTAVVTSKTKASEIKCYTLYMHTIILCIKGSFSIPVKSMLDLRTHHHHKMSDSVRT